MRRGRKVVLLIINWPQMTISMEMVLLLCKHIQWSKVKSQCWIPKSSRRLYGFDFSYLNFVYKSARNLRFTNALSATKFLYHLKVFFTIEIVNLLLHSKLLGLQQHAIIHTDQKPFECDICRKSFRFKSNLFEHRSVHTGNTPHRWYWYIKYLIVK